MFLKRISKVMNVDQLRYWTGGELYPEANDSSLAIQFRPTLKNSKQTFAIVQFFSENNRLSALKLVASKHQPIVNSKLAVAKIFYKLQDELQN